MTRLYVAWAFVKWMFVRMFKGVFNIIDRLFKSFYSGLKQGGIHTAFSIAAFVFNALLLSLVLVLILGYFIDDHTLLLSILQGYFVFAALMLFYNIIQVLFEQFEDERQDIIDRLKN